MKSVSARKQAYRRPEYFLGSSLPSKGQKTIPLEEADGRVLCGDVTAPRDVPHYDRSAMDGYAVRAEDTFGSSRDAGLFLRVSTADRVGRGECQPVHTGSPIPAAPMPWS
jgi:molybdopterin molybdotransferase